MRALLMVATLAVALPVPSASARHAHSDLAASARETYVWGMPLVEAALIRDRFAARSPSGPGAPFNRFVHARGLAGPEMRSGVGPNNDTVYSLAWLDLASGPLVLRAPDFGSRYYTFSINQVDSTSNQSLGQRTHGGLLPPLFIHGPGFAGRIPRGMVDVPSISRFVNVAGRILVRGPGDYEAVHRLQDGIELQTYADYRAGNHRIPPSTAAATLPAAEQDQLPADLFLARLAAALRFVPSRLADRRFVRGLALLGFDSTLNFHPERLSPVAHTLVVRGIDEGRALVERASLGFGTNANGWRINYRGPRFGDDMLLRAAVAKDQIFVAVPEEALYPIARQDSNGRPIDGRCSYRIVFRKGGLPPVGAFWSLTAYGDDGFMIENALHRYSIGDRTSELAVHGDGSVVIVAAHKNPRDSAVNWLPLNMGPSYLMMRLYRPLDAATSGRWRPPPVVRIACGS